MTRTLMAIVLNHSIWAQSNGIVGLRADLSGADLSEANLREANLSWANLREADLRGAQLAFVSLCGARLEFWVRGEDAGRKDVDSVMICALTRNEMSMLSTMKKKEMAEKEG